MDLQLVTNIATTAVGFLAAYLAKAGEVASEKAGEDIYQRLKARFRKKPAAGEALADLEKKPDDADLQAAVRVQLKKLLEEDQAFVTELQQILQTAVQGQIGATTINQTAGAKAQQFGQVYGNVTLKKQ